MRSLLGRFHRPNARSQSEQLFMLNNLGDGSTLSLDFTTGVLDSRVTFTRSTTATYINSSGFVTSAAINTPRFDYDPTTLTPRGLLIEGNASNLLNWSESFATSGGTNNNWADTSITRNSTNNTDPASGTTALRVTASAGNGTIISTAAMGTSAERTFSIWLRRVSGTGNIQYTLDNGSTYTTQAITSSWVRYTFAATTAAQRVGIRIVTSGDSIELWGAQLEAGSGASSYIPTGASQGSRAFDSCVMNDITSCNYSTTNGSMYYEGRFSKVNTAAYPWRAGFTKESTDERCFGFLTNSGGSSVEAKGPGATPTASVGQTIAVNTDYKIAWSLDASLSTGEVRKSSNGSVVSVSGATALTVTGTPTYFMFGQKGYQDYFPSGTIKAFKYWPTTLSDGQLQASTT